MAILADRNTRVLVQGLTGAEGSFHTQRMLDYGTQVVAGVTPGKGGTVWAPSGTKWSAPVFNTVEEAVEQTGADASVIFVPKQFASDAVMEAASAGVELIVAISDGIPVNDMLKVYSYMEYTLSRLIGPNCPGLLSVGECKLGIMPNHIFKPGPVGVISRSGTLTYEVVDQLSRGRLGQTTCIGVGGDPIIGTSFLTLLMDFEDDPETECVVIIGEIGGSDEEEAADYIHEMTKPVIAFISGRTAPPGKRMGHAGAIVSGGKGTAESKIAAFKEADVPVADTIPDIVRLCKAKLGKK
jgi:succinyl-CoA synthetase alpha subunit